MGKEKEKAKKLYTRHRVVEEDERLHLSPWKMIYGHSSRSGDANGDKWCLFASPLVTRDVYLAPHVLVNNNIHNRLMLMKKFCILYRKHRCYVSL